MHRIKQYAFHKTKYGEELLIDVVRLKDIKKYLKEDAVHRLGYHDITLITDGHGKFRIDEKEYYVRKGDVIFSSPNQIRWWDINNITDGYALIFEKEFLLTFFNDPDFLEHLSYFKGSHAFSKLSLDKDSEHTLRLINEIKQEIDSYKEKDKHILRALLYQTLKSLDRIYILRNSSSVNTENAKNRYADTFIKLVGIEYKQNHSIRHYADKLCITPNYLNELVKSANGISAKQVIQNKVIQEAKKMLLYSSFSISDIAASLNYENTSYFIRFFRKQTGYTPLQYRNADKP
ncbi:helix-turn-helix domain-containing protein [Dysgonomonas sp. Marseille-P4677]|uniref:AraC family transcriptional regulator n=1 Tax=Dysgonomonas sp. Marseille-P4677 TaxID=2364790 RepID=UPI00191416BD|nr:helix-turn-helix domain-containing protein [Dysgonomonas sp. Marseille-P4677]MBK5720688.1 helix-turn-helix domain-containing protein [Dysgonomonas sp. Marseille-P4677]